MYDCIWMHEIKDVGNNKKVSYNVLELRTNIVIITMLHKKSLEKYT